MPFPYLKEFHYFKVYADRTSTLIVLMPIQYRMIKGVSCPYMAFLGSGNYDQEIEVPSCTGHRGGNPAAR